MTSRYNRLRALPFLTLGLLIALTAAGCSKDTGTSTPTSTQAPSSATSTAVAGTTKNVGNPDLPPDIMKAVQPYLKKSSGKTFQIGLAQSNFGESWRAAMDNSMKDAVAAYPDLNLQITDGQEKNAVQVGNIETFVTQKKDLIIVCPNEAQALTPAVSKAYASGIPIILLDRTTTNNQYTVFMGGNNVQLGHKAGEFVAKALHGKPAQIVELEGIPDASATIDRHNGLHSVLDKTPGVTFVDEYPCNYDRAQAITHMENLIQSGKQFNVVIAHNDDMALGAVQVLQKAGRKEVMVIGADGKATAIKAIMDGQMAATFTYPYMGKASMEMAQAMLNGYKPPKIVTFPTTQVDATNAAQYYNPNGYL